jgi:hypothetical protein
MTPSESASVVEPYGASYRNFANELFRGIRREAFGAESGQTGWLTADKIRSLRGWDCLHPVDRSTVDVRKSHTFLHRFAMLPAGLGL